MISHVRSMHCGPNTIRDTLMSSHGASERDKIALEF
jgi:hypothetical protein